MVKPTSKLKKKSFFYKNYDLTSVVTPVKVEEYQKLLVESNFDKEKTAFLVDSFTNGFPLGYDGNKKVKMKSPNLKLRVGSEIILWNKVMKEIKAGRFAGPFEEVPYEFFIQSPIGLVPKDGGKETRLIFHLSYPRKGKLSVNANTPDHLCKVKYPDFAKAVEMCMRIGVACHIARSDLKSAFRNLCMRIQDFCWLIMKVKSPLDGKWYYIVDKCLPFGASISCSHFQLFSDSLAWVVQFKSGKMVINYLDDYLFAALIKSACDSQVNVFLTICKIINFPVNLDKTWFGVTTLTFLGMLIDTLRQVVCVPVEKIQKALNLIGYILSRRKITVHQLQRLCGFLNFLCKCVVPGRAFTRRLYAHTSSKSGKLLPHHHIRVTQEMKLDLQIWNLFLQHPSVFSRPFIDFSEFITADELDFYTDASGNFRLGFGGICGRSFMFQQWDTQFMQMKNPSIQYMELFAVAAAVLAWINRFKNRRIIIFTDNDSVKHMINNSTASCKNCMVLIRFITLECLINNVRIFAKYVPTDENSLADSLSRLQKSRFYNELQKLNKTVDRSFTEIPSQIWPISKIWMD